MIVAVSLVALVIMLRDAWRDRGVIDEDDWVADEVTTKRFFGGIGGGGGISGGGCGGGG